MSKRLFIGVLLEDQLSQEALNMLKKLKTSADKRRFDVRWTLTSNIHITLKFLGSIEDSQISDISLQLKDIASKTSPITLNVHGLGGFPSESQARVLWIGLQNKIDLQHLHALIEEHLARIGIDLSEHEYTPHITLGRFRNKKNIKDLISPFVRSKFGKVKLSGLALIESQLHGPYPVYKTLELFNFANSSTEIGEEI